MRGQLFFGTQRTGAQRGCTLGCTEGNAFQQLNAVICFLACALERSRLHFGACAFPSLNCRIILLAA